MTDESHEMDPVGEPASSAEKDDAAILEGAGEFTSGEGLISFAGIVLLAVWFIFDLIVDSYGMDNLIPVVATVALLLPRLDRGQVDRIHPLPVLMKLVGWTLVLLGVVDFLIDVRFGFYDTIGGIIGALAAYAGYVMAFMGARQIKT